MLKGTCTTLAFAGVLALVVLCAGAAIANDFPPTLGNGFCDPGEDSSLCIQTLNADGSVDAVIEVLPENGQWPVIHNGDGKCPSCSAEGYPNSPCPSCKEFPYMFTRKNTSGAYSRNFNILLPICPGVTPPKVNYILSGATNVASNAGCPLASFGTSNELFQVQISMADGTGQQAFSIFGEYGVAVPNYVNDDTGVACNSLVEVQNTSPGGLCSVGNIRGPTCPLDASAVTQVIYKSSDGTRQVQVTYDSCNGQFLQSVDWPSQSSMTPLEPMWVCESDPRLGNATCHSVKSFGSVSGTLVDVAVPNSLNNSYFCVGDSCYRYR